MGDNISQSYGILLNSGNWFEFRFQIYKMYFTYKFWLFKQFVALIEQCAFAYQTTQKLYTQITQDFTHKLRKRCNATMKVCFEKLRQLIRDLIRF